MAEVSLDCRFQGSISLDGPQAPEAMANQCGRGKPDKFQGQQDLRALVPTQPPTHCQPLFERRTLPMAQIVSRLTQRCVKSMQKDVKICETPMDYLSDIIASLLKAKEPFGKKASSC